MVFNTATVSMAVTPTVVSTLFSHYLHRKPRRKRPTAHLSYDEGLHLIRAFLIYASHHPIENVQAFMSQWVPHPQWVRVEQVTVPEAQLVRAAAVIEEQLGPDGIRLVGGRKWWQWRKPKSPLQVEWIEMRADYNARRKAAAPCRRVMLYVHGGAYFMGSVDEHRYQLQRHARKLKARVFAPRYRLAPQFPFPCGLQDCLAAYLHLLTLHEPSTILLAGDSSGGGMVLSMLVTLRDRGLPLPAGATLISPWVDLTHSFPSVSGDCPLDYIPPYGFHHRPSMAWPPPTEEVLQEMHELNRKAAQQTINDAVNNTGAAAPAGRPPVAETATDVGDTDAAWHVQLEANRLSLLAAGGDERIDIQEQIQLYTTNAMLDHPLVSPILQPTLGGLPPLLVLVGGGEILRDEQMFLAHKCAHPAKYVPSKAPLDAAAQAALKRYPPTNVQLQVWDDLCHVAPTLSFTRPGKLMYRSVAQFGAWALARAQQTGIDILDDDAISVISASSSSEADTPENDGSTTTAVQQQQQQQQEEEGPVHAAAVANEKKGREGSGRKGRDPSSLRIGKAGDPLPPFKGHMIRQRVTVHGDIFPLAPASELPACSMALEYVGVPKQGPVNKWLAAKQHWDTNYARFGKKVYKRRLRDAAVGFESFGPNEYPPPSALAGRRKIGADLAERKPKRRSPALALWSRWGSKHDENTVEREQQADRVPETETVTADGQGNGTTGSSSAAAAAAAATAGSQQQPATRALAPPGGGASRSRSRRRVVRDEQQTEDDQTGNNTGIDENTSVADLIAVGHGGHGGGGGAPVSSGSLLGVTAAGREEIATASNDDAASPALKQGHGNGLLSPDNVPDTGVTGKRPYLDGIAMPFSIRKDADTASMVTLQSAEPAQASPPGVRPSSPLPTQSIHNVARELHK
ncbi:lipase esterase family protein [Niveomyces insectorum RCEF 264]|uniref:Lipase esterase family protein n=1 Tax=Niveomyces insectorum RCEF 264 TaxID=1081102 RepID=A0A167WUD4_9HYPO|nr:lipase esterase family protein [Niveomyces insectorum RCEF 264]